jgi:hypothetical protein
MHRNLCSPGSTVVTKCANPACGKRFTYFNEGKLFLVRYRPGFQRLSGIDEASLPVSVRHFWLCAECDQRLTIQPASSGGVRIAARQAEKRETLSIAGCCESTLRFGTKGGSAMDSSSKLNALRRELEFLEHGGYRIGMGWRQPLIFEDSPICAKDPGGKCGTSPCVLLDFVAERDRNKAIPCRHIPLNKLGEDLDSLYSTAPIKEIESAVQEWLQTEIEKLTKDVSAKELPGTGSAA